MKEEKKEEKEEERAEERDEAMGRGGGRESRSHLQVDYHSEKSRDFLLARKQLGNVFAADV